MRKLFHHILAHTFRLLSDNNFHSVRLFSLISFLLYTSEAVLTIHINFLQGNQTEKPSMKMTLMGGRVESMEPNMVGVDDGVRLGMMINFTIIN